MNKKTFAILRRKVLKAGGAQKVGVLLGTKMGRERAYTRQSVSNWCKSQPVPAKVAIKLEAILGLPRSKIRPDLWSS